MDGGYQLGSFTAFASKVDEAEAAKAAVQPPPAVGLGRRHRYTLADSRFT